MPWVKLDDRFPSHRKIALLSDRAFRLHISAICWCSENLTDGRIGDRELALVAKIRGVKATAQQLADAGVWDRTEDGWEIHDYLDYNPSREQVIAERKKNAERQEKFRRRKNGKPVPPDGSPNPSSNGVTSGVTRNGETRADDTTATRTQHDGDTTATRIIAATEGQPQVSEFRNAVTNDAPSRPVPEPLSMADAGGNSAATGAPGGGEAKAAKSTSTPREITDEDKREFGAFWAVHPRSRDIDKTRTEWIAAVVSGVDPKKITEAAEGYAHEVVGSDFKFVKQSAGWIRERRYEDKYETPAAKPGPSRPLPPWCGECADGARAAAREGHLRQVYDDRGNAHPCPKCHPAQAIHAA